MLESKSHQWVPILRVNGRSSVVVSIEDHFIFIPVLLLIVIRHHLFKAFVAYTISYICTVDVAHTCTRAGYTGCLKDRFIYSSLSFLSKIINIFLCIVYGIIYFCSSVVLVNVFITDLFAVLLRHPVVLDWWHQGHYLQTTRQSHYNRTQTAFYILRQNCRLGKMTEFKQLTQLKVVNLTVLSLNCFSCTTAAIVIIFKSHKVGSLNSIQFNPAQLSG